MPNGTVLVLVGPEYEDLEVWYPKLRFEEAGYAAPIAGLGAASYTGKHGYPCKPDGHVRDWSADQLAGIVLPGGWAPDRIRRDAAALALVRAVHDSGKLVATICHGPWIAVSAGIVRGRRVTSSLGIRDDLVNAGGIWEDAEVVCDRNLISSRAPADLPAFSRECVRWLEENHRHR